MSSSASSFSKLTNWGIVKNGNVKCFLQLVLSEYLPESSFLNSSKRGSVNSLQTQAKYVDLYLANPKKKIDKDPELIRYEKEQAECTFKPKIRARSNMMMRSQNLSYTVKPIQIKQTNPKKLEEDDVTSELDNIKENP